MHVCTIIARNYLAHARVLAKSFRRHHPDGRFTTLILDDLEHEIGSIEPFEVIRPADIMDIREFHRMAMIYSVVELSTAVKPWLLQTLLDGGSPVVTYLDPDIQFFAPIEDVPALASEHSIVLTPHATEAIPHDGRGISEQTIMLAGTFNLGFIAVSSRASGFLAWWQERLARECRVAPSEARFVDQRFVDLVPGLFEHYILRDPTVNVAYWNVIARHIEWTGERYEIAGSPLRFYHFSGFDLDRPWLLSKHQGDNPRVLLSEHPGVSKLCVEYADSLIANGYSDVSQTEYAFTRLSTGTGIDDAHAAPLHVQP